MSVSSMSTDEASLMMCEFSKQSMIMQGSRQRFWLAGLHSGCGEPRKNVLTLNLQGDTIFSWKSKK